MQRVFRREQSPDVAFLRLLDTYLNIVATLETAHILLVDAI